MGKQDTIIDGPKKEPVLGVDYPKKIGSIIALFDKTPKAKKNNDVHCPHFWELKYANGCKFDCQWCLDGQTKILMADLRWKDLKNIEVGDKVVGWEKKGSASLFKATTVEAIRETNKERVRLTTNKGEIVCSLDHQFLSSWGRWATAQHLAMADCGIRFLTPPVRTPSESEEYMVGYLQGVSDGDGTHGIYKSNGLTSYKYRLAMADVEAIDRAEAYWKHFDIDMKRFMHQAGSGNMLHAIRKDGKHNYDKIMHIMNENLSDFIDYHKGYIAGMYDAEGSLEKSTIRISNQDETILSKLTNSLSLLSIPHTVEDFPANHETKTIRIKGGMPYYFGFLGRIGSAIPRKNVILDQTCKFNKTDPVRIAERIGPGKLYDIQTGTENFIANGFASHNCYLNGTFGRFQKQGDRTNPKIPKLKDEKETQKAVERALKEIPGPQLFNAGEVSDGLAFPATLSNIVIPLFKKHFEKTGHKLLILTKSTDTRLLNRINAKECVIFSWSINASYVSYNYELKAPDPIERLIASRTAHNKGYETRLRLDPMVPVANWHVGYRQMIERIMTINPFVTVITLGSLRGLNSTVNACGRLGKDMSWKDYLTDTTNWGMRVPEETRVKMYMFAITELRKRGYKGEIALCKESLGVWKKLIDPETGNPILGKPGDNKCNCVL